jgi:hypothetical protein
MSQDLKIAIFNRCQAMVLARIDAANQAMEEAQAAANENTKSSAGDKYETGRAMMQLERDKAAAHLATALQLQKDLDAVPTSLSPPVVGLGSLVRSSNGWFFLSAPLGKISLDGTDYWAISPNSPLGKLMVGRQKGEKATVNGRDFEVLDVY